MADAQARLFVAVEVPSGVRDGIDGAVEPLRRRLPNARWVAPQAFHVTLAFIGAVDDVRAAAVEHACAEAAAGNEPFGLALSGRAGTFGDSVLWAELVASAELARLAGTVRDALADRGLDVEQRAFHAHVTLARAGRSARITPAVRDLYVGPRSSWRVERVAALRSRLGRLGAPYGLEGAWLLGDRPAS